MQTKNCPCESCGSLAIVTSLLIPSENTATAQQTESMTAFWVDGFIHWNMFKHTSSFYESHMGHIIYSTYRTKDNEGTNEVRKHSARLPFGLSSSSPSKPPPIRWARLRSSLVQASPNGHGPCALPPSAQRPRRCPRSAHVSAQSAAPGAR